MAAGRDLKILIKTIADMTGLSRLGRGVTEHSRSVRALGGVYRAATRAGAAGFRLVGSAVGMANRAMRHLRNAVLAGAAALAVATREGAKFNISLARTVNMASGNKLGNFIKFRKEILNLSSATGIATAQINDGLYQALSAQMNPDQAFVAIRKAVQGVVADGAELKDVMSGIIAGVKSFGGDVGQTAEQLYRIVQLGQTTFGEVGAYLSQVAPVAAANKVSLGEVGGAIAQLTSKTIPLSQGVVMLRNMMSRLNDILGDGWRQSYTFQEAMEAVAKSAKYSQAELGKLFGREGMAGVNALVGDNFADAKKQAAEFGGELRGLVEGADFADRFRGFEKLWQSVLNFVKEIGSEIEMRWAPRIQQIAAKLAEMQKGDAWLGIVDTVSAKLEASITWVMVQAQTIKDLIQEVRSGDIGVDKIIQVGKVAVVEIVSVGVEAFLASLQAAHSAIAGIGSIIAASFLETILASDLPGMGAVRARMVKKAIPDPEMPRIPTSFVMRGGKDPYAEAHEAQQRIYEEIDRRRDEVLADPQRAASMVAGGDVAAQRLQKGIDQFTSAIPGLIDRVTNRAGQAASTIGSSLREQTGFDYGGRAAQNEARIKSDAEWRNLSLEKPPAPKTPESEIARHEGWMSAEREADKTTAMSVLQLRRSAAVSDIESLRERREKAFSPAGIVHAKFDKSIDAQEAEIARVENVMRRIDKDTATISRLASWAETVAANQQELKDVIRRLPI